LRKNLNELEKISIDDQLDVSGAALLAISLSRDEVRKLMLVVNKVVARFAVPQVEIADDEGYPLLIHFTAPAPLHRADIAASTIIPTGCFLPTTLGAG